MGIKSKLGFMKSMSISLLLLLPFVLFGQEQAIFEKSRIVQAYKTSKAIKIDGKLDEEDWQMAEQTSGFSQRSPNPLAPASKDSDIKVMFNDEAIFVGALLKDDPDSINTRMTERDEIFNSDWFGMIFCPYQDGINGVGFILTAQGVQFDTKYSASGEDTQWDAVWDGEVTITDEGWIVEMKILYSALRFPNSEVQTWDINFVRNINRLQETSFWYPIDRTIAGFLNQTGKLEGIKNIKPPVRLSATPFVAGYLENYKDGKLIEDPQSSWGRSFNAGMDIKYGLSDAFTLDMTLIPDFGEAQSDNQILNLSPFEVRFDENRQFFTEGTELFNKGNLFYSRRAGGKPLHNASDFLRDGEEVINAPQNTQLFNATKISGRSLKGTGLGFFNAISGTTKAVVGNETSSREVEISPLSNYNVMVVDQNLKNNSYISLVNTNVIRRGDDYDANVTGLVYEIKNKNQTYSLSGGLGLSQKIFASKERHSRHIDAINFIVDTEKERLKKNDSNILRGHKFSMEAEKISGNFNIGIDYKEESHTLDINDLGFQRAPNIRETEVSWSYTQFEPFGKFNSMGGGMDVENSWLYNPGDFLATRVSAYWFASTKNFWNFNLWGFIVPTGEKEYYEARRAGRYLQKPKKTIVGLNVSTDRRKKVSIRANGFYGGTYNIWDANWGGIGLGAICNLSDRFSLFLYGESSFDNHDVGFVNNWGISNEKIIMGQRRIVSAENEISGVYSFSKNMSINARMRHYWSSVIYGGYFELGEKGQLLTTGYEGFHDLSFNFFNIDLIYRWRFAPGSDLFFIWKNAINDITKEEELLQYKYPNAIGSLGDFPERNSISLKLVYFLDYASLINS